MACTKEELRAALKESLRKNEGKYDPVQKRWVGVPYIYIDSLGYATVGFGTKVDDHVKMIRDVIGFDNYKLLRDGKYELTEAEMEELLSRTVEEILEEMVEIFGNDWKYFPCEIQLTFAEMGFQLGGAGLRQFKQMIKAAKLGDKAKFDLNNDQKLYLSGLFSDKKKTISNYSTHPFMVKDVERNRAYYRGLFGFSRDLSVRGIPSFTIEQDIASKRIYISY